MEVFVTGVTGYVGGSVAACLMQAGHGVRGLVRNDEKASALRELGIDPVYGTLDDTALLRSQAKRAGAVVNAADSDHRGAVVAFIEAMAGTNKPLLHTSGISIVGDEALGEPSQSIFHESTPIWPHPEKSARREIDELVLSAAGRGVRSVVLCNGLIYGHGLGLARDSLQLPLLMSDARTHGVVRHIGRGLNIWSTVHINDVADLYLKALEGAAPGLFMYVEYGEAAFRDIASALATALGLARPVAWPPEDAVETLGRARAVFSLGSNARVRGSRARDELGWAPKHSDLLDWIRRELNT